MQECFLTYVFSTETCLHKVESSSYSRLIFLISSWEELEVGTPLILIGVKMPKN